MKHSWRIGIVGLGFIGIRHARILSNLPGVMVPAGCDLVPEHAKAKLAEAGLPQVRVYSSLSEMLAEERLDCVTICAASGAHLEPAVEAMRGGLNVIVEKPVEISVERIDRMIEAAQKAGLRLAGIFQNRYADASRLLKSAVDEGRFGRIAWASATTPWYRDDAYYAKGNWRGTRKLDGGGAMMNQSIHAVDLLQWFAGPVKRVAAFGANRIHPQIEVEDTLTCCLEFASGACGVVVGTTAAFPGGPVRIEIGAEHGTAVLENGLRKFVFRQPRAEDEAVTRASESGYSGGGTKPADIDEILHARSFQGILAAWDKGVEPEVNGLEARKAVAIVQAMYQSVRRGGAPVAVAES